MFKNLLLGVSLIVTAVNISPAQAQTSVATKLKIKGLRNKKDTTLTQLFAKHDHSPHLSQISSVISDTVAEKENIQNLERTLSPKGDVKSKIGFFNSFFGNSKSKNDSLQPAAKEGKLTQKTTETVDKTKSGAGSLQTATPPQKSPAVSVANPPSNESVTLAHNTTINEALLKIQLRKSPARTNILLNQEQNSAPWVNQLTPSLLKAIEKANRTRPLPIPPSRPSLDLTPVSDSGESKGSEVQPLDTVPFPLEESIPHTLLGDNPTSESPINTVPIDTGTTSTMDMATSLDLTPDSDIKTPETTQIHSSATTNPSEESAPTITLSDDEVTTLPMDITSFETGSTSILDLTPDSDIKESKVDEIQLSFVPPPPPPPMPPSGIKATPKSPPKAHENSLDEPITKMDQASSVSLEKTDDRSNLLEAIRQGKTLKKTAQSSTDISNETAISRIDETIINTTRTDNSEGTQGNGLFKDLFKSIGNFLSAKNTGTTSDSALTPPEGARLKDYSITYKHTVDDGFIEETFVVYFTSEAAKNSYINKISSFDDEEDQKDFAESYSLSPAQAHIRQLQNMRATEVKRLEDITANKTRKAQLVQETTDDNEQRKTPEIKITPTPAPTVTPIKTESDESETIAPKITTGGTMAKATHVVGDLLSSIKGFTLTSLNKVKNIFKPADKPKDAFENEMINRRKNMGYDDKDDLDWD